MVVPIPLKISTLGFFNIQNSYLHSGLISEHITLIMAWLYWWCSHLCKMSDINWNGRDWILSAPGVLRQYPECEQVHKHYEDKVSSSWSISILGFVLLLCALFFLCLQEDIIHTFIFTYRPQMLGQQRNHSISLCLASIYCCHQHHCVSCGQIEVWICSEFSFCI